jgi:hypothetical protein
VWSSDAILDSLINSAGIDEKTDTIEVTGLEPTTIETRLKAALGQGLPVRVQYEDAGEEFAGRNYTTGRIHAGDHVIGVNFQKEEAANCTAGFGAWDVNGLKSNGEPLVLPFLLTAGHCARPGEGFYRQESSSSPANSWQRIGHVARTGLPRGGQHYETDGSAVRLTAGGLMPYYIYKNGEAPKPVGDAGRAHHGELLCFSGAGTNETKRCGEFIGVRVRDAPNNPGRQLFLVTRFAGNPGDSGAPVWSPRTQRSVGLVSGDPKIAGLVKDWVTPLLVPRGHDAEKVPGILNAPGMGSLNLAVPGS